MKTTGLKARHPLLALLTTGAILLPLLTGCNGGDSPNTDEAASHIERAETYTDQGQYRSALLEVRNAIKADPDNVDHVVMLAELYLDIGAAREAAELLEPWMEEHTSEVALPLATAYVRLGKHLSARETLDQYQPQGPGQQTEATLLRAEALRLSGDATEALSLFRNLMENHPSNPRAALGTLRAQLDLNQASQAARTANDWLQQNPPDPRVRYWKGAAQYQENNLEGAAQTLTDAASELPASDVFLPVRRDILTLLSRVLTEQGKAVEAQVYNKILAEHQDTSAREQGEAAIAALQEGNVDEAKRILGDMLEMNPDNRAAALMLGALNTSMGDTETGSRLLTENLDPETTPTPFLRAATMAQIDTGKREEALQTLERALEARPNDNDIIAMHGILALSFDDEQHQKAGIASLQRAINNEPDRTRLRLALANHYLTSDQPEPAIHQLLEVARRTPDRIEALQQAARLYARNHPPQDILNWLDGLAGQTPELEKNADVLAALVNIGVGNLEQARERLAPYQQTDSEYVKQADIELLLAETRAAVNGGNYGAARAKASEAIGLAPNSLRTLLLPAAISQAEGDLDRALEEIDAAEQVTGKAGPTIIARTSVLEANNGTTQAFDYLFSQWQEQRRDVLIPTLLRLARNEGPEALGTVTKAWIEQQPQNPAANMARADWLVTDGQEQLAISHYETVLDSNPGNPAALNNLAWILRERDPERALALSEQASQNAADNPMVLDTYGWLLHLAGQHDESIRVLEQAVALAPENEEISAHLEAARQAL
ncbi:tetratricopeptide repeat protein [Marinobacter nauticus]